MNIKSVAFRGSFKSYTQCPVDGKPEFAFIGRSNVGKSSLINMLVNRKDMVRVSNKPGKTQSINYFLINDLFYLVDLPGYGYARVSKTERIAWKKMIAAYFTNRPGLACVYQLIDIRLEPQAVDIDFTNQLGEWQVPLQLVFTKCDKVSKGDGLHNIQRYFNKLRATWDVLPHHTVTSAEKTTGREAFLDTIRQTLEELNC